MKVAIIGLGFRLGYLGYVFSAIDPEFEIVGYVDPAPAGLDELRKHGISAGRQHATPEELIAGESFDLLMIGSPNHMHLEHIRLGLEAGLKVFSEKPIVASLEQTYALARLLAVHGQERLLVGLVLRYAPMYRDLRAAQAEGRLGNDRVDRGGGAHLPLPRRLLHARLAALREVLRQLHAGEVLPRPRPLQLDRRQPPGAGGELRRAQDLRAGERPAARGAERPRALPPQADGLERLGPGVRQRRRHHRLSGRDRGICQRGGDELPHQPERARPVPPLRHLRHARPGGGRLHPGGLRRDRRADRGPGASTRSMRPPSSRSTTAPTRRWRRRWSRT